MNLRSLLTPSTTLSAHCDLPCGVYDPAQARIEAESVRMIQEKYQGNDDPAFRTRALTMSQDFFVLSRDHTVGPNSWVTTFTLAPTEPRQAWILGDTTWGALGATTIPVY